jgi:hypothetical protein
MNLENPEGMNVANDGVRRNGTTARRRSIAGDEL